MLMLFGCASVVGVVVAVIAVQCLIWSGLVWSALCVRACVCVHMCVYVCVRRGVLGLCRAICIPNEVCGHGCRHVLKLSEILKVESNKIIINASLSSCAAVSLSCLSFIVFSRS